MYKLVNEYVRQCTKLQHNSAQDDNVKYLHRHRFFTSEVVCELCNLKTFMLLLVSFIPLRDYKMCALHVVEE